MGGPPQAEFPPAGYLASDIEARVADLMAVGRRAGWPIRRWKVRHDLRGAAAGQAWPREGLLRFNPVLGAENWPHFLEHTVAHEVAHLLACWRDGDAARGHGPAWREAMALLGVEATRCHDYDTTRSTVSRQRRWRYRCACAEPQFLTTTRHNRVRRRRAVYVCRRCGGRLVRAE